MQQEWGCLGLRLISRERILKVYFPSLCLQLLIFQSDWSHNCQNKDGHYLPSVFTTGNEANCPQGRKWLPICGDTDDDFEKDESEVAVIFCWKAAYGIHPLESLSKWQLLWKKGNCFEGFSGEHYLHFLKSHGRKFPLKLNIAFLYH